MDKRERIKYLRELEERRLTMLEIKKRRHELARLIARGYKPKKTHILQPDSRTR